MITTSMERCWWLVEFWLAISSLPDDQAKYMGEGVFAQSMTGKPYSCLPLDLWIEMTMTKRFKYEGWLAEDTEE